MDNTLKSLVKDLGIRFRIVDLPCVNTHLIQFEEFTKKDYVISDWEFRLYREKYCDKPGYIRYEIRPSLNYGLKSELLTALKSGIESNNINFGYSFREHCLNTKTYKLNTWDFRVVFYIKEDANKKVLAKEKKKYIAVAKRKLKGKNIQTAIDKKIASNLDYINNSLQLYNKDSIEKNVIAIINDYILKQLPTTITPMDLNLFKDLVPLIKEYKVSLDYTNFNVHEIIQHLDNFAENEKKRLVDSLLLTKK